MLSTTASAQPAEFSFGVIGDAFREKSEEAALREAIAASDRDNLGFVVVNGLKSRAEACTEAVYARRKSLFDTAKNGLVLSLGASDWIECKDEADRSAAVRHLNRVRETFFLDEFSLGASRIPLSRQSTGAKFRNYSENARWEIGEILFATINLPANNNNYQIEAGRNNEFEERLIANRDWLQRIFTTAASKKMTGIVLFCDGNPLAAPGLLDRVNPVSRRDGFKEIRQQIAVLSEKYPGRVLVIHGQPAAAEAGANSITWRGRVGELGVGAGWVKLNVNPAQPSLFMTGRKVAEPGDAGQ